MTRTTGFYLPTGILVVIAIALLVFGPMMNKQVREWEEVSARKKADHELALQHLEPRVFELRNARPYEIVVMRGGDFARVLSASSRVVEIVHQCSGHREKRYLTDVEFLQSIDRVLLQGDAQYGEVYARYLQRKAICGS